VCYQDLMSLLWRRMLSNIKTLSIGKIRKDGMVGREAVRHYG
jgi:hypothetical protein